MCEDDKIIVQFNITAEILKKFIQWLKNILHLSFFIFFKKVCEDNKIIVQFNITVEILKKFIQ